MTYTVEFSENARKDFEKLEKSMQERIVAVLERIRFKPFSYAVRIVGEKSYRFRVGEYRIIADIDQGRLLILVIGIGHRSAIHKR